MARWDIVLSLPHAKAALLHAKALRKTVESGNLSLNNVGN
jgi:hypothetical protein